MSKAPVCGTYCKKCDWFIDNDKIFSVECPCATEGWYKALKREDEIELKEKWNDKEMDK